MEVYVNAIYGLLGLLGLWLFTCVLWRDYRNDALRQELFELRDRLFDLARSGRIGFNDRAYIQLRSGLNALLYSTEHMSVLGVLMLSFARRRDRRWKRLEEHAWQIWTEGLSALDSKVAQELDEIRIRADFRVIEHLVLTSPLLQMMIVPAILVGLLRFSAKHLGAASRRLIKSTTQRCIDQLGIDVLSSPYGEDVESDYVPVSAVRRC